MKALLQVDSPYPDELLYSVLARSLYHLGCESPKRGLEMLFGVRDVVTTPDLPTFLPLLGWLWQRWRVGSRDVALRSTTLPYYLAFRSAEQRHKAVSAMAEGVPHLIVSLGIAANRVERPLSLRYCPACIDQDVATFGEPYWRRVHQLPGVWVCPEHEVPVHSSSVLLDGRLRHAFVALAAALKSGGVSVDVHLLRSSQARLVDIARASASLLEPPETWPAAWPQALRGRAGDCGYLRRGRRQALVEDVRGYFSDSLLAALGMPDPDAGWLLKLIRKPRSCSPTLHHLLAHVFFDAHEPLVVPSSVCGRRKQLGPRFDEFVRESLANGSSIHAIAKSEGVAWKTVQRRVVLPRVKQNAAKGGEENDRHDWVALIGLYPGKGCKALRHRAPALYARLYRRQRDWLREHSPREPMRTASKTVANWAERDEQYSSDIVLAAMQLRAAVPPKRLSVARLLRTSGHHEIGYGLRHRLPRTYQMLDELSEPVEGFQVRRLEWHSQRLLREGHFSISALQRAAGLKVLPSWARTRYGRDGTPNVEGGKTQR